ncbi:hypothetical protein HNY73_012513 [Argiope bruennichi]|uniref:Uncharacterized protein n=1 Tax=Argiope bruennichi TaxID=94029 RepID=A0A8T0F0V3_ARGBR|nr:hypothetical protein HNY73_012513 [Argiope bruennichi]
MTLSELKKSGTLPICTKPTQNEHIWKHFEIPKSNEVLGQNILLESLSKNCPDYSPQKKRNPEMVSEDICYLCMHEMTAASPIRRHNIVPGYTGYIPGKMYSCGERFTVEWEKMHKKFLRKRILSEESLKCLAQNLTELPSYFEVWYEIPRGRIREDIQCY